MFRLNIHTRCVKNHGFTLLELLVSISIIAGLAAVIIPNYLGARERARDTKIKAELEQVKQSLRTYYNDFQRYPAASGGVIQGCREGGAGSCPCSSAVDFAVSAVGDVICATPITVYMKKFPPERTFGTDLWYYASADGEKYCIVTTLENLSDPDIALSQSRCTSFCGGTDAQIPDTSYVSCSL